MSSEQLSKKEIIDKYFLEHRAKALDIAAFLDRIDRCDSNEKDFRIDAFMQCIEELQSGTQGRAQRILELLSDQTTEPIDAAGEKGASGAAGPK